MLLCRTFSFPWRFPILLEARPDAKIFLANLQQPVWYSSSHQEEETPTVFPTNPVDSPNTSLHFNHPLVFSFRRGRLQSSGRKPLLWFTSTAAQNQDLISMQLPQSMGTTCVCESTASRFTSAINAAPCRLPEEQSAFWWLCDELFFPADIQGFVFLFFPVMTKHFD